jgi:hypothetical protein
MANSPNPDRNVDYMMQMWGTNHLVTDYGVENSQKKVIQEIMHDDIPSKKHHLKEQSDLHKKIRNDEDYDDWEYGTEPSYGTSGL